MSRRKARKVDYGELPTLLGYQLRRAHNRLFQGVRERVGGFYVTPGQYSLLVLIARNEGLSQVDLAVAAGIERSTLGEVVDRFRTAGWVERRPSALDSRSYALHLTTSGHELIAAMEPEIRAHEQEMAASLSREEFEILVMLLAKVAEGKRQTD